jgi:hypothetical protein
MDIHKPKPWHGLREFLKEYVIIVVGVLTALGAEQLVEWSHWRSQLGETRETIRSELARDLGVVELAAQQDLCQDQRVALLDAWADGKAQVVSRNLGSMENRMLMPRLRDTAWEVAKSGAVATHMSPSDRLLYGDLYDRLATETLIIDGERDAWRQLGRYVGKTTLSGDEARRLKEDLGMIRSAISARRYNKADLEQRIGALGIKPASPHYPPGRGPRDLCEPPK